MIKIEWKRVALWILVGGAVAVVSHPILGTVWAVGQREGSAATAPDKTPLYLPNHRYDLPALYLSAAQIQAQKLKMLGEKNDDVPINMVQIGGSSDKHQAGISLVYRLEGQSGNFAVHDDVAEVYQVLEGSMTMQLGGKLIDPMRRPVSPGNGMGLSATQSEGSQEIKLAQGDMLIIPAGTPHKTLKANEFTVYTVVRIDADGVTPLLK